ncbi:hypothetical protein MRB53_012276 [Persea americana]|uniref:Uncharacterized protein n=1 Tax=Persea americana TaxID=3435 RepID=A0ACC2LYA3_PERAE|nr:hypothetical protein MRB53_012276 [Persea americana]
MQGKRSSIEEMRLFTLTDEEEDVRELLVCNLSWYGKSTFSPVFGERKTLISELVCKVLYVVSLPDPKISTNLWLES